MAKARASLAILFIGNSYTDRNDLPGMLTTLAAAAKPSTTVTTDRVIANGMSLRTHWNRGVALEAIRRRRWDFVVLQDQSTMGLKNPERLKEYVAKFSAEIVASKAKPALYLTWARQNAPQRQVEITRAYTEAAADAKAVVVPVGLAWECTLRKHPEIVLHEKDLSHPTMAGTYLSACVFYRALVERSARGLPAMGVEENVAGKLRKIASEIG